MLTEQFLNSCFLLTLNKNISKKGMNGVYRDILEILHFYKKKEKGEIPIILKNKVDCLEEICGLRVNGRASENIIDSLISHGNKFKELESFMVSKLDQMVSSEVVDDNIKQVYIRKKIMIVFPNYDTVSTFLDSIKDGTFNSTDEVTDEFEGFVKDLYSNLMKIKREESVKGSASLDLSEDSYESVISLIKSKYHEELITSGFSELDSILRGGFQKGRLYIFGGGSGCVDKDTEFFNGIRWKKISEWDENDLVLQYNKDGSANLVKPKRYIETDCEEFNYIENTMASMMFCDFHNHVYLSKDNPRKLLKINTKDLLERHNRSAYGFSGRFLTTFGYEGVGIDLSDDEIRLMIMILSYGYVKQDGSIVRIRTKIESKQKKLVQLLNKCSIQYIRRDAPSGYSVFYFNTPENYTSALKASYWFGCNKRQLEIIADECLQRLAPGRKAVTVYCTSSKEFADFIQFVFATIGKRTTIKIHSMVCGDKYNTYTRKHPQYSVSMCRNRTVGFVGTPKQKISRVKSKDGKKYCFEVDSGMLVLRRNNKIFCTGNSGKSTFLVNIMNRCVEHFGKQFSEKLEKDSSLQEPKKVFIYITLENLIDESLMRMYQSMFDRSYDDLINLVISEENIEIEKNIYSRLNAANTTIIMKYFPKFSITPTDINMIIEDVASIYGKENIKAVLVDYLDLLEMDRIKHKANDMYRLELSKITSSLKDIAVEHNLPLVTLTQLGRDIYGKSFDPKSLNLGLISEAIKKVEHADFCSLMVRDSADESKVYMYIGKNRGGKSNVHMIATVDLEKFKFIDIRVDKNNEKVATANDTPKKTKDKDKKLASFTDINSF